REQRPKTAKAVADELAIIEREATQATADERTVQVAACGLASRAKPQAARRRLWLVAASLLLLLGGVAAAIVVIIRDKQGNKIAEINAPRGSKIEIQDDGKDKDERKAPPVAPKEAAPIAAALAPLRPGEPLSPAALVRQPAKLPGVRSWSIEKRDSWMTTVVAYRPDGKRLAVGDTDGRVRIWEPQSGRLVQMAFDAQPVSLLAWSPDGKLLAVGVSINAGQSAIQLWDAQAGRTLWRVETPWGGGLSALAWSADGRTLLATVTNVGCLTWNPADGKLLRRVAILCGLAAFSPDAKRLAGGTGDNRVALWDVETGKEIRKLDEHKPASLPSLAWSPDGKRLALTAADSVYVWQAETGERIGHYKDLTQCCFACWSPNGSRFAVSRYRINQSAVVDVVEVGVEGEPRRLEDDGLASLAWSPDGNTIARIAWGGGGGGGWVRLYDAATGKRLRTVSEDGSHVPLTALSRDGQTIAVWENGRTTVASVDTGSVRAVIEDTQPPLALSPDGQRVVTGGPNHALILWESGGKVRIQLAGHEQEPAWASWSPDGKRIASKAHEEKRILLWDAASGERLGQLGPFVLPPNPYRPGLWSPDGRLLAFVPVTGMGWHFWDVEQNKLVNDPKKWNEEYLALSPDGHSALTWKHLSSGQLQEIVSGKKHGELATVIDWGAAYSPDGRQLAVQVSSGCQLWRGDLRRRVRNLERPRLVGGGQLTFSADGKVVLGISGRRLHVWETDTGRLHGVLYFSERWNNLTIAANGHYNGNELVERGIVMVVQKDDGTQELLEPADFEQKYGWKNDPNKVHLLQPLPPPLYPLPGQPMGPNALVREPAPLPEVNSWTVETLSARHLIRAVAYRTDSKRLATGGEDGTIRIWDTSTGELVRMLSAETWVHHLSWSRDGRILAANCADAVIRLWDADTGGWRLRIPGYAMSFFWSPDGRTIAVTDPSKVCFHDLATGKLLRSFNLPGYCGPFAWSPDGKRLAFAVQGEKALRVINTESGKEIHRLEGHAGPIYCVAWSPDGKQMASGGRNDAGFRLWDMVAGKLIKQVPVEKVWENTTQTLAWSPDGRTVALGFVQGPHGLYDVATGRLLHSPFAGQSATAVAISPDGKQAVMADAYGVRVHNASTSKLAHVLEKLNTQDGVRSLAWSPDNRRLAVGIGEGVLLDAATGKRELSLPEAWRSAVWSADGKMIATAGAAGGIRLWDAATYRRVCELEGKDPPASLLAWSPDGKRLAAGDNRRIWVWSSPTGKLLWKNDKFGVAFSLVWSPDGRWLAATDNSDKTQAVRIFHGDTGELYMESPLTWETQAAWSPDGKTLAAGPTEQGECLLIDAESGKIRVKASAKGGRHHIRAIRWAADGSTFSTMDRGDFQRTFDAATGKQLRTRPIALPLGEYRWSPDGRILACSTLYKVHLYDENFWPLGILLPGEPFARLAVAADGHYQGNARVERQIRILVQRSDGTTETLTPHEFEQKYNFKNDPAKVRLIEK
ncbi:MAG TPA: WD40 repeat domain-containing protein, partial [Gemmataceae bacterium]|nr:WD40 repeat domain-containing protein [Gemmataceae bacterium]